MRSSKFKAQSSNAARGTFSGNEKDFDLHGIEFDAVPDWAGEASEATVLRETPPDASKPYELGERTAQFGEAIVRFAKKVPRHPANDRLISQIVGAGTSIGANYCEANEAVSQKDFLYTISRCVKEAKETRFFLRMIVASEPSLADLARPLWSEATELLLILASLRKRPSIRTWNKPGAKF